MIKLKVTQKIFDEVFSIDDWLNLGEMTNTEMYEMMLHFVVDDEGQPVPKDEARKLFKKVPKKEWTKYVTEFIQGITDAFVNPTNGGS